ncbi:lipoprotein [Stenotrophomonas sp. SORGH_AS_0321]|uniref:LPS translocon maturation chaperone LptM n=1 Tax=Stenotrophomonas sp. SORGH_AS_0321 TaxID=3041787 RepID=UPI0028573E38|nr:lipoprotein [Stenotrophomonas sp. SORGH_AS_0321]MDR6093251.1 putative small lipoprotein YifL [Stenotrophomonas sp. SORGH_AS_0321]
MNNSRRTLILIPLAASALLFLSACGNKGPLVLPQKPVPVEEVAEPVDVPAADDASQDTGTPPATQDTGAGNPSTVPDPVTPQIDDGAGDNNE